jgi:hypothetical protein
MALTQKISFSLYYLYLLYYGGQLLLPALHRVYADPGIESS